MPKPWIQSPKAHTTNLFNAFVTALECANERSTEAVQDVVDMAWGRHFDEDAQAYFFYSQVRILICFRFAHNFRVEYHDV